MAQTRGRPRKTTPTTAADIDRQIERLKERKRRIGIKAAERFVKIATECGLLELGIADADLRAALSDVVTRFQSQPEPTTTQQPTTP